MIGALVVSGEWNLAFSSIMLMATTSLPWIYQVVFDSQVSVQGSETLHLVNGPILDFLNTVPMFWLVTIWQCRQHCIILSPKRMNLSPLVSRTSACKEYMYRRTVYGILHTTAFSIIKEHLDGHKYYIEKPHACVTMPGAY